MIRLMMALGVLTVLALAGGCSMDKNKPKTVSVLVVTGGHKYEKQPFTAMFDAIEGMQWSGFELTDDSEVFEDISNWDYDVVVFYNMTQNISAKRRANFLTLLDRGVGVVVLHHSIVSFNDWPEYKKIIGAKYYQKETTEDGIVWPASTYQHDVQMPVHIADTRHPITAGLRDFTILDETYKGLSLEPDNHLLLTTEEPTSQKEIGWTRLYRKSRICTIQLGHGPDAYNHPAYRKLLCQAIQWTAGR
jgi:type 1 glutamine amidotransferase